MGPLDAGLNTSILLDRVHHVHRGLVRGKLDKRAKVDHFVRLALKTRLWDEHFGRENATESTKVSVQHIVGDPVSGNLRYEHRPAPALWTVFATRGPSDLRGRFLFDHVVRLQFVEPFRSRMTGSVHVMLGYLTSPVWAQRLQITLELSCFD